MINILKNKLLSKENIKYTIILMVLVIGFGIVVVFDNMSSVPNGLVINEIEMLEKFKKDKIGVYIDGEVNKVGYIQIPKGETLEYAINKAKGITKEADIQNIDLSRVLKNQEKIIIPKIKEKIEEDVLIEEKYEQDYSDVVNINTASRDELTSLEGIGEKTAERIIEYRENNSFDSLEEIMEVKGIGEGKFEKIKGKICV